MPNEFHQLFNLRRAVARVGQADWLAWWDCHSLTPTGDYVVPRLFRRTPEVSAAHVAFMAARAEHQRRLPKARLVHLFDFGEALEGEFERWLVARKRDGWTPETSLPGPSDDSKHDAARALKSVGLTPGGTAAADGRALLVETVDAAVLEDPASIGKLGTLLAGSYGSSAPGSFIAPYVRIRA